MKRYSSICATVAASALVSMGLVSIGYGQGGQEQGFGPGFGMHRPPMEQALGPRGTHGEWWNNPSTVDKLKLTDEQRKAMDQIMLQHRETLIDMRANVEKAELGMEPLMHDDQPNEAKILAQIDKVAQARAELEKANARFLLALRGKLTPEQWKQLQAFRNARGEHREWRDDGSDRNGSRQGQPPMGGSERSPQAGPQSGPPPGAAGGPQGMIDDDPGPEGSKDATPPARGAID